MTIRIYVREEVLTGDKKDGEFFFVYKNPSQDEIRKSGDHPRILITNEMNLYICDNSFNISHDYFMRKLVALGELSVHYRNYGVLKHPELGVILQLDSVNRIFYLSESYTEKIILENKEYFEDLLKVLEKYKPEYSYKLVKFNRRGM